MALMFAKAAGKPMIAQDLVRGPSGVMTYTILYYTILYCTVLNYAILYYTKFNNMLD